MFTIFLTTFLLVLASTQTWGKLLVDYHGGQAPSKLGSIELERFSLGDHVSAGKGGSDVFIKSETDALGLPALHYKRSAHFRRAEMRILDHGIKEGRTYYVGFTLRLTNSRPGLVFFQWKKADKFVSPRQNIPFHMEFVGKDELTLGYTTPGGNGSQRKPIWHGKFSTGNSTENIHKVAFAINTKNDGSGWLEFYLDGVKQKFDNGKDRFTNAYLYTGRTFPKLGIYRGEAALGNERDSKSHVFNSFVYRVQISDRSLEEIAEAAGLDGTGSPSEPEPEPTSTKEPEPPVQTTTPPPSDPEPTASEEPVSEPSTEPATSSSAEPEPTSSEDASPTTIHPPQSQSTCKKRRRSHRRGLKRKNDKRRNHKRGHAQ